MDHKTLEGLLQMTFVLSSLISERHCQNLQSVQHKAQDQEDNTCAVMDLRLSGGNAYHQAGRTSLSGDQSRVAREVPRDSSRTAERKLLVEFSSGEACC